MTGENPEHKHKLLEDHKNYGNTIKNVVFMTHR